MSNVFKMVEEFHRAFNLPVNNIPDLPNLRTRELRVSLIREEFNEYIEAENDNNIVKIADGLADLIYVCVGAALVYGIPLDKIFEEIHKSNMTKLGEDGKPVYREDGKVIKGPNYVKPDIAKFLANE